MGINIVSEFSIPFNLIVGVRKYYSASHYHPMIFDRSFIHEILMKPEIT